MARQLDHPSDQIRVLFAASEAQSFLRGGAHMPGGVRFRFGDQAVMTAGEDPRVLADWIAANTPDLAFAVEQERAVPLYREPA